MTATRVLFYMSRYHLSIKTVKTSSLISSLILLSLKHPLHYLKSLYLFMIIIFYSHPQHIGKLLSDEDDQNSHFDKRLYKDPYSDKQLLSGIRIV